MFIKFINPLINLIYLSLFLPGANEVQPGGWRGLLYLNCVVVQLATELRRGWLALPRAALRLRRGYQNYTPYGVISNTQNHTAPGLTL
jgi:hypothetical protein